MRETLFRGRQKGGKEWFEGDLSYLVHDKKECYIFPPDGYNSPDCYEVDPDTVGQYVGIPDKKGNKIFDGDIIRFRLERKWFICSVQWSNAVCAFVAKINDDDPNDFFFLDGYMLEVIGNIYDNPEILEVKK